MNATELLQILEKGGQVSWRWKYRYSPMQKPKKLWRLHYPDGGITAIQESMLTPLIKQGKVWSASMTGGGYTYRIKEQS